MPSSSEDSDVSGVADSEDSDVSGVADSEDSETSLMVPADPEEQEVKRKIAPKRIDAEKIKPFVLISVPVECFFITTYYRREGKV
jgi:hypothetical protein